MSTETVVPSQSNSQRSEVADSVRVLTPTDSTIDRREPERVWHVRAACRGPHQEIFYPPTRFERRVDKRRREARAKEICRTCSVVEICLDQAIERREPYGIWGGLTEHERRDYAELKPQTKATL